VKDPANGAVIILGKTPQSKFIAKLEAEPVNCKIEKLTINE